MYKFIILAITIQAIGSSEISLYFLKVSGYSALNKGECFTSTGSSKSAPVGSSWNGWCGASHVVIWIHSQHHFYYAKTFISYSNEDASTQAPLGSYKHVFEFNSANLFFILFRDLHVTGLMKYASFTRGQVSVTVA